VRRHDEAGFLFELSCDGDLCRFTFVDEAAGEGPTTDRRNGTANGDDAETAANEVSFFFAGLNVYAR